MGRHSAPEPAAHLPAPADRPAPVDTQGQPALALRLSEFAEPAPVAAQSAAAEQQHAPVRSLPEYSDPKPAPQHRDLPRSEPHTQPLPILPTQRRVTVSLPLPVVEPEPPAEVEVEVVLATPVRMIQPVELPTWLPAVAPRTEPPVRESRVERSGTVEPGPARLPEPRSPARCEAVAIPSPRSAEAPAPVESPVVPPSGAASRVPRLRLGWAETGRLADLAEHLRLHGELPRAAFAGRDGAVRLVELTERAGLRGRGGGGFPTGRKMRAVLAAAGARRRTVVVANGCESDLTSGKDTLLLHGAPHLVLDGLALAAHAVGADQAIVCLHRGSPALESVERAIAERADDPCELHLVTTPGRYVSSEASALVNFLTSGDARPTTAPPLSSERGVQGRPTLVDNVETLAHLALLARHGADWFRSRGTASGPGTMLITLDGAVRRPGVYEVDMGIRARQLVRMAGGTTGEVQAMLLGGLGGNWLPLPAGGNLALGYDECQAEGVRLGVASLVLLPADACGLGVTSVVISYLAGESAGQCGPCMFGLPALAQDFAALAAGSTDRELAERLDRRLGVIPRRGACAHPDGAVRLAASALRVFASDVAHHLRGRRCGRQVEAALPLLAELPEQTGGWR